MLFDNPIFESITVELPDGDADAARAALDSTLGESAAGWAVQAVPGQPGSFDLVPPSGADLTLADAWDLTYLLRETEGVVGAEPAFEIDQDHLPEGADLEAAPAWFQEAVARELAAADVESAAEGGFGDAIDVVAEPTFEASEPDWSPRMVRAPEAWALTPPGTGRTRGEGIRVGHPDSGYRVHHELFAPPSDLRVRQDLERDFVDDTPLVAENPDGGHGLGTGTVLMSLEAPTPGAAAVTGVAPAAELVPLRVAKKRPLVPVPVLLGSGTRRLRDAIHYAIENGCHVISISLGWLKNRSLRRALKAAEAANLIVVAAAGNMVRFVVWPARYPETIACAGCTADRRKWRGSSRGKAVDVTAPARGVWKASVADSGARIVEQSSGTSYATATTAGLAALWLAHHGRQSLLDRYAGEVSLTAVFRHVLAATCDPPPPGHDDKFGAGIVNGERLLARELPTAAEVRGGAELAETAGVKVPGGDLATVLDALGEDPVSMTPALAEMMGVDPPDLEGALEGVGDEVAFRLLTTPGMREQLLDQEGRTAPGEVRGGLLRTGAGGPGEAAAVVPSTFTELGLLSSRVRERLR